LFDLLDSLDESESHPESHQARSAIRNIRFSGVVEIKHLAWLTHDGQQRIQHDIHARDEEKRAQQGYLPTTNMTLNRLFVYASSRDDIPNIKVRVEGKQLLTVSFLTCESHPRHEPLSMN
jgi:hypothetical protein